MSLLVQQREGGYNPSHWAAPRLLFAWRAARGGNRRVQNAVRGREALTAVGSTVSSTIDGFGLSATAADNVWSGALRKPSLFSGDLTLLWRGVLIGDPGTGNNSPFFGVMYGPDGFSNPYAVFALCRLNSQPNILQMQSNDGANYISSNTDIGLSNYYNIPLTIAVSNVSGSGALTCVLASPARGFISAPAMNSLNAASGAPRASASTDLVWFGTNYGAGRYANVFSTGGAIWNIAMNAAQLRSVAVNSDAIFRAPSSLMTDALMSTGGGAPGPTTQSGSGYNRFRRPFGNPFHRPF